MLASQDIFNQRDPRINCNLVLTLSVGITIACPCLNKYRYCQPVESDAEQKIDKYIAPALALGEIWIWSGGLQKKIIT